MTRLRLPLHVANDHPSLVGHFPGFPIVPGVVLLDETLHAIETSHIASSADAMLWHIATVKFHHVVHAGDELQLECDIQADGLMQFELRARGTLVASGTLKRRAKIRAVVSTR